MRVVGPLVGLLVVVLAAWGMLWVFFQLLLMSENGANPFR